MWGDLASAVQLDDTQLILIFAGALVGLVVLIIIYMLWKRSKELKAQRKWDKAKKKRKKKRIREVPEPGTEDEEESYVMTLYDLLNIKRTASDAQIKRAYRNAVKNMHPDKTGMDDRSFVSSLNIAKHTLLDPGERKKYDEFLDRREVSWIHEAAGEVQGPEHRIMVTKGKLPRLAPGEQVCRKSNEFMDWDE